MELKEITTVPGLPARAPDAHKGDFGRVLVVAGSRGMAGAASLCAQAALKSGAGLVHLALPEEVYPIASPQAPCVICHPMPQTSSGALSKKAFDELSELASQNDVVALGPGLTTEKETVNLILRLVADIEKPMVVDADGINALASDPTVLSESRGTRILTPHPGEMARLTGKATADVQAARTDTAADFAAKYGVILVLKGANTVVTDGRNIYINKTGNAGMATAGAGDVLTGLTAGLLGQGMSDFEAACLASQLHGLAGDAAKCDLTEYAMTARDIMDFLPQAFAKHAGGKQV